MFVDIKFASTSNILHQTSNMIHHSQTCINITTTHRSHDSIRHLNFLEKSVPLYGPSLPSGQAGFKNHEEFRRSPHLSFLSFTDLTIHSSFDDGLLFLSLYSWWSRSLSFSRRSNWWSIRFLIIKCINGEKATYNTGVFSAKRERTFQVGHQDIRYLKIRNMTQNNHEYDQHFPGIAWRDPLPIWKRRKQTVEVTTLTIFLMICFSPVFLWVCQEVFDKVLWMLF